jgi:hypothetical protein
MSYLSVAGIVVNVSRTQPMSETIERIGSSSRAYSGNLRTTVRSEKRTWKLMTAPMIAATAATLRAAITLAAQVSCTGDMLGGSTVTCEAEVNDAPYIGSNPVDGLGYMRVLAITLREV